MLITVLAFVVTLGILIAVHEYGHYRVAVTCGVKVLKFSIGFGKPIFTWRLKNKPTEFSIGILPFGGYVKMLDEREAPVDAAERHLAFNTQPLKARAAVVAAGPAANLVLAILIYAMVNWIGIQEPKAVIASPVVGSLAENAGLRGGETVLKAGFVGDALEDVQSFEDLRWRMTRGALEGHDLQLLVASVKGNLPISDRAILLPLSRIDAVEADATLFRAIGIMGPWTRPVLGEVMPGGAAEKAGLKEGDFVQQVGSVPIVDGQQLREAIRNSAKSSALALAPQAWTVLRGTSTIRFEVTPEIKQDAGAAVPRIGAYVGLPPEFVTVKYGLINGLWRGAVRTWEVSALTLKMMGKMVIGEASLKNLSGPLTIADYAGKSANMGWSAYLVFLALISVSLGVLNLLPLPVLDGGHLMYYLWEAVTGHSVSDAWMERMQRGGIVVLLAMMSISLFNDVTRLLG